MKVLGICDSNDSSSALVDENRIVGAIEEERIIRKRHIDIFPYESTKLFLRNNVNKIAYGMDYKILKSPSLDNFQTSILLSPHLNFLSSNYSSKIVPLYYKLNFNRLKILRNYQRKKLSKQLGISSTVASHHKAHAASSYRVSGFKKANILVIDGSGEKESTSLFVGNKDIEIIKMFSNESSLGTLYTIMSILLGFGRYGQGKLMGLASYGTYQKKLEKLISISKRDYKIDMSKIKFLLDYKRKPCQNIMQKHKNLASTLQTRLIDTALMLVEELYEQTGYKNLCLAGGVALNCKMNFELLNSDFVKNIYIPPAPNDAGTSLGAALELATQQGFKFTKLHHAYLGPKYSESGTRKELKNTNFKFEYYKDIEGITAELISKGKIIGWFQGRMEFGPRALGNRSILADPTDPKISDKVNDIKHRERWRPLAPSLLEERMGKYFEKPYPSPFMSLTFQVKEEKQKEIPSVIHVDGSARVQTVNRKTNLKFYKVIKEFGRITGTQVILNTSFNDIGQPIVMTPKDAIESFKRMNLDYLTIGNYLVK